MKTSLGKLLAPVYSRTYRFVFLQQVDGNMIFAKNFKSRHFGALIYL